MGKLLTVAGLVYDEKGNIMGIGTIYIRRSIGGYKYDCPLSGDVRYTRIYFMFPCFLFPVPYSRTLLPNPHMVYFY